MDVLIYFNNPMEKIHSVVGSGCKADFQWVQACSRNPRKNPLHTGQLLFKACKDAESIGCRSKDVTSIVFFSQWFRETRLQAT